MKFITILFFCLLALGCANEKRAENKMILSSDFVLDEDLYKTQLIVDRPVNIDLGGYVVDGDCNTECEGLSIRSSHVIVSNGTIKNFDGGVHIAKGLTGVTLNNIRIEDNVNHGLFVDSNVMDFTCNNCEIVGNGDVGLYLEHGSQGAKITGGEISSNGYRNIDTGSWYENFKNGHKAKREGVAIDASQYNIVTGVTFKNNALNAISLYKNCGERGVVREVGANDNQIVGNTFINNNIHIASRQDKDLSSWDCAEEYIYQGKYTRDEAQYNRVSGNHFTNAHVIVHDDNNSITNNTGSPSINSSSFVRKAIGEPVNNLIIEGN